MNRWEEIDFQESLEVLIQVHGGRTDRIENRRHPGNSDVLFSLPGTMGVIECKKTNEFKDRCKLRLKHPLSADQRKFLIGHGVRAHAAFMGVLFSNMSWRHNFAIFWRWNTLDSIFKVPLQVARCQATWNGSWPIQDIAKQQEFIAAISERYPQ